FCNGIILSLGLILIFLALFGDTPNIKPPGLKMCLHKHFPPWKSRAIEKRSPIGTHPFPGHDTHSTVKSTGLLRAFSQIYQWNWLILVRGVRPGSDTNCKDHRDVRP